MNKKYFVKTVNKNKNNNKNMYNFLKEHFTYFTLNSWNDLRSIANNVKVYNIDLDYKIIDILGEDEYYLVNNLIRKWENNHKGYNIGLNGRSGGYLVLYNENNSDTVLDYYVNYSDDYNDFKNLLKDDGYTLKDYHDTLLNQVELVQDFDLLCEDIRDLCVDLLNN